MTDVAEGVPTEAEPVIEHDHEGGDVPHTHDDTPQAAVPQPQEVIVTESAFLVFMDPAGHWVADGDRVNAPVQIARNANFIDMHNACTTITKDIVVQETARQVVGLQQQVAQQVAEQMRTAELAKQIGGPVGSGLDLSKLRQPGS
jgi:hypothetical protein